MRLFPCPDGAVRGTGIIRAMLIGLLLAAVPADAQNKAVDPQKPVARVRKEPVKTEAKVVERGLHHARVEWFLEEEGPDGKIFRQPRGYTKLETGLHYWDATSKTWRETQELIKPAPGGAVADEGPQKVTFSLNVNDGEGSVSIVTPDGQKLRGGVLALAYFDTATQKQLILALAKDARGRIVGQNQVIYQDAFEGVNADVLYTYTKAGLMQEVIFKTQPPAPEKLELSAESSLLQVLTEWTELPAAKKRTSITLTKENGATLADEKLDFGSVQIGAGQAFWKEEGAPKRGTPVGKKLIEENGRKILFESVPYKELKESLKDLPDDGWVKVSTPTDKEGRVARRKADSRYAGTAAMASSDLVAVNSMKGVSVDWSTVNAATNLVLQGDITYRVQGPVTIKNLTIEGGTVVKFDGATNATITVTDAIVTDTADYRPAVFTHLYDGGMGENIASGTPTRNFGLSGALRFDLTYFTAPIELKNLRISWAQTGIAISDGSLDTNETQILRNVQFVNTGTALDVDNAQVKLLNGLVVSDKASGTRAFDVTGGSVRGEQLTLHKLDSLGTNAVEVVNTLAVDFSNDPGSLGSGSQNLWSTSGSSVFTGVVFGNHYLPTNSAYLNSGTTNVDTQLLVSLGRKTTQAPVLYSNFTFSAVTTLGPTVARDVNTPDLGFHYDPLDYVIAKSEVSSNLTFSAGTAVGWFYSQSGSGPAAFHVADSRALTFNGTFEKPCYWIRSTLSQEGSSGVFSYNVGGISGTASQYNYNPAVQAHVWATFTKIGGLARYDCPWRDDYGYLAVHATHSEMWDMTAGGYILSMYLTNCFFDRSYVAQVYGWSGTEFAMQNGTMRGGYLDLYRYGVAAPFTVRDVAFDGTAISQVNGFANANIDYSFNAYTNGAGRLTPTNANDRIVTNFNWQVGPLGNFYLPTNSPLIDFGSTSATNVGLYHFTTQTSQINETNSTVDIGYHYVSAAAPCSGVTGTPQVVFMGFDSQTKGDWRKRYGWDGQKIMADTAAVPGYVSLSGGGNAYTWDSPSTDVRSLQTVAGTTRIAACWYDATEFTVNLDFTDQTPRTLGLYFLDWENGGRIQTVEIRDLASNTLLDSRKIQDLSGGLYLVYRIAGDVKVRIVNNNPGYNAVLSGLFFSTADQVPKDSECDGIADYREDANGNGSTDSGETNFLEADSDYDGVTDGEELVNGTDPLSATSTTPKLLASFCFNSTNWIGDQGQVPLYSYNIAEVAGVEGSAAKITGAEYAKHLRFRTIEENGKPNMSFSQGTIMFWFKPNWNGTNRGGAGPVPYNFGRLVNLGEWGPDFSYGFWSFTFTPDGDWLGLGVHTNNGSYYDTRWGMAPGGMVSNQWRHIALTYSSTNVSIYVDGTNINNSAWGNSLFFNGTTLSYGTGNILIPPKARRDYGANIGTDTYGAQGSQGTFDLLETYNYPLSESQIRGAIWTNYYATVHATEDADYDGRSNHDEVMVDGTDPNDPASVAHVRLASFRFNSTNWIGDQGQLPSSTYGLDAAAGVEGTAARIVGDEWSKYLSYRQRETNGQINLTLRNGTISLWFKPSWTSTNQGGAGLPNWARLFELFRYTSSTDYFYWRAYFMPWGGGVDFEGGKITPTSTNTWGSWWAPIAWKSNEWHHIAVTYSSTNCAIYLDGQLSGDSVTSWGIPLLNDSRDTALSLSIGTDGSGTASSQGTFDLIQTFNYPLSAQEIQAEVALVNALDSDGDGLPNFLEMRMGLDPSAMDSDGNGIADGDEDQDGDFLSNLAELTRYHTDPLVADSITFDGTLQQAYVSGLVINATRDSDGDGLSDYAELHNTPKSKPDVFDSDGDGISDGVEFALGLNRMSADADSDGDGLPDNWEIAFFGNKTSQGAGGDPDGDGLSNVQELRLGLSPTINNNSNAEGKISTYEYDALNRLYRSLIYHFYDDEGNILKHGTSSSPF